MKKVILMVTIVSAFSMVSCSPKTASAETKMTDTLKVDTSAMAIDSVMSSVDSANVINGDSIQ